MNRKKKQTGEAHLHGLAVFLQCSYWRLYFCFFFPTLVLTGSGAAQNPGAGGLPILTPLHTPCLGGNMMVVLLPQKATMDCTSASERVLAAFA